MPNTKMTVHIPENVNLALRQLYHATYAQHRIESFGQWLIMPRVEELKRKPS